jgi:channel protein (hemolysin III family)
VPEIRIYSIPGFNDPVSSWSHLLGALVFAFWGVILLRRGWFRLGRKVSLAVFVFSTILLLSLSGVYHLLPADTTGRAVLLRLDHAAIFILIAGSYTPPCAILFRGMWRWLPLLLMWSGALAAVTLKVIFFDDFPAWLGVGLYLLLGWAGVFTGAALWYRYGYRFVKLLLWGGLAYTAGAVLDYLHWPVLIPGIVGPHELFHLFVLAGLVCHWSFMFQFAAPRWVLPAVRREEIRKLRTGSREQRVKTPS